jgi:hypothetical protein
VDSIRFNAKETNPEMLVQVQQSLSINYERLIMKNKNKKKIETLFPSIKGNGKCRVDSVEGCRKYFEKRFKKFIK